jgi:hypothetical protein
MRARTAASTSLLAILFWPALFWAQTQPASQAAAVRYPDQGFLSDSRYTNQYFGFAFDFPAGVSLQPVHRPVAPDGGAQLLELAGPSPHHAVISITAQPRTDKRDPDAKQLLRKELDNELFYGVEELRGLSKISIGKHQFYYYETRRGIDEHFLLASDLDGYVLRVYLAGRDDKLVAQLQAAFVGAKWFDPSQAREVAGSDAKPYEGPAMSSHRLATLKSDSPASHLDPGTIANDQYVNRELGLAYHLPHGWILGTQPAVQREVERIRQQEGDAPWIGRAEAELVKACNRVLFSAWKEPPAANGRVSYDGFGEITLSAMAMPCFPDMHFPSSVADTAQVQNFLAQFALTHPMLRDTRRGRAFESDGHVFIVTEGVVTFQIEGEDLSRRLSIAMATTEDRGWLLTWFFGAPHDSELRELMDTKMMLEPEQPMLDRTATREVTAGGGTPTLTVRPPAGAKTQPSSETPAAIPSGAATSGAGSASPTSTGSPTSAGGNAAADPVSTAKNGGSDSSVGSNGDKTGSAGSTTPTSTTSSDSQQQTGTDQPQASQPPSLLRPGESMNDQQMSGTPLPKKH